MSLFDLQGRTALVTGATQGLGLAIARTLAEQGARVVVSDRDALACEQVAASLPNAIGIAADMAVPAAIAALVERAGPLDILVCNAGIQGPAGPLANASDADWQQVFDINLRAAARLCALVLPGMAARGGGSAVLISSIAGLRGNRSMGLYGLTKAALPSWRATWLWNGGLRVYGSTPYRPASSARRWLSGSWPTTPSWRGASRPRRCGAPENPRKWLAWSPCWPAPPGPL